jgi:hypothetical protein
LAAFCTVFVGVWVGIRGWLAFETVLLDFGVWVGFGGWHAFCVCFFAFGFGVCLLARILCGFCCGLGLGFGSQSAFSSFLLGFGF